MSLKQSNTLYITNIHFSTVMALNLQRFLEIIVPSFLHCVKVVILEL
jgi:hypothetical protein